MPEANYSSPGAGTGPAVMPVHFADVFSSDCFYDAALWAYYAEPQVTNGTDATHFTPNQTCSTAHIITFLYRTMGIGDNGWYQIAEAWAKGAGLLDGLDITVAPKAECSRCDMVLFLYRQLGESGTLK